MGPPRNKKRPPVHDKRWVGGTYFLREVSSSTAAMTTTTAMAMMAMGTMLLSPVTGAAVSAAQNSFMDTLQALLE